MGSKIEVGLLEIDNIKKIILCLLFHTVLYYLKNMRIIIMHMILHEFIRNKNINLGLQQCNMWRVMLYVYQLSCESLDMSYGESTFHFLVTSIYCHRKL